MLAITIAVVIIFLALPSLRGMSAEKRLTDSFDRFDALARKAQRNAVQQQRAWTLIWEGTGITLQPDELVPPTPLPDGSGNGDALNNLPTAAPDLNQQDQGETMAIGKDESFTIERPVALKPLKDVPAEWTFWRSGTCEPVIIRYAGPAGTWTATYHPLTGHGEITEEHIR